MPKSKFFRVATEGATTDGRNIARIHIQQMAKNYNPEKFGARVWIEHIRGYHPESMFSAMGDVVALKTEENKEGKLVLLAQIDPTDELIQFNKKRKAVYSSIELDPNFADTGEAYLAGLAVTDSPASLGTEMLKFSSQAAVNPLASKKQKAENLFSEAVEFSLEFEESPSEEGIGTRLFNKVMAALKPETEKTNGTLSAFREDVTKAVEMLAVSQKELMDKFSEVAAAVAEAKTINLSINDLEKELKEQVESFIAFKTKMEETPTPTSSRPVANGNGNIEATDC